MKKIYQLLALITILVSGCSQDEVIKNQSSSSNSLIYTASFEGSESRTYLNENGYLRWTANDQISIFEANTYNQQYQFTGETGDNSGTFEKVSVSYATGTDLSNHYAIYPYNPKTKISETGVITATIPAEQTYAVNSFGLGDNTMVAVTADKNDTFLKFKNVGGYLELNMYGDDVTVKTITLEGNSNEKIAGTATIAPVYGGTPSITMADDAVESITLDCGEGVTIGSTVETATAFLLVVPPTTFERGFTITITDINGSTFTKSTSKSIEIERNIIKPMNAFEAVIQGDEAIPYLTFTADAAQSLTMSMAVATLEYSVNGEEWKELGTNIIEFGGRLGNLRLRGSSLTGTSKSFVNYSQFIFGNDVLVSVTGDIRTLIDSENYKNADTSNAQFQYLFKDCTNITSAPELPATILAESCYNGMFTRCTNLVIAPELPATKLTNWCYEKMFLGCTSLKTAPKLPAMALAQCCYSDMFYECTSLELAPELPATTLAYECYQCMFGNCKSLVSAPQLPARTLDKLCYASMFANCTSLTSTPELPATTLSERCYISMFSGCTNLETISTISATTLANYCCQGMFASCTSLTSTPELPATTLKNYCYSGMFSGCTNLTTASKLPATILSYSCYSNMFKDCTKLTNAPELPATILAKYCYSYMFLGCTSLTNAPELPATILMEYCYEKMFWSCKQLNHVTMLATDISADCCLSGWLEGVSSIGTIVKSPDLDSFPTGWAGVPSGWTIKNYGEE